MKRIIPGWFDKKLKWRNARPENLKNVLLIVPSPDFIAKLPFQRIPDRQDFYTFTGRDAERIRFWKKSVKICEELRDAFHDALETNKISKYLKPLI